MVKIDFKMEKMTGIQSSSKPHCHMLLRFWELWNMWHMWNMWNMWKMCNSNCFGMTLLFPCSVRYASWELERLVRKMFLRLFTALLPVTLFPALHMAGSEIRLMTSS